MLCPHSCVDPVSNTLRRGRKDGQVRLERKRRREDYTWAVRMEGRMSLYHEGREDEKVRMEGKNEE